MTGINAEKSKYFFGASLLRLVENVGIECRKTFQKIYNSSVVSVSTIIRKELILLSDKSYFKFHFSHY